MTNAYMLIALIIAGGSCQEPRLIIQKMASLELCQAAANLASKAGGQADCLSVASASAGIVHAGRRHSQQRRFDSSAEAEEVQQLNRAQLGDR